MKKIKFAVASAFIIVFAIEIFSFAADTSITKIKFEVDVLRFQVKNYQVFRL